jgi:hypothetical protein
MIRKAIISYLIIMIISPPLTAGAATIPGFYGTVRSPLRAVGATQLPVLKSPNEKIKDGEYVIDDTTTANRMVINQQRDKIVVDWKSFDIGSSASVHFDQRGNTNWAAQSQPDLRQTHSGRQDLSFKPERDPLRARLAGEYPYFDCLLAQPQ